MCRRNTISFIILQHMENSPALIQVGPVIRTSQKTKRTLFTSYKSVSLRIPVPPGSSRLLRPCDTVPSSLLTRRTTASLGTSPPFLLRTEIMRITVSPKNRGMVVGPADTSAIISTVEMKRVNSTAGADLGLRSVPPIRLSLQAS